MGHIRNYVMNEHGVILNPFRYLNLISKGLSVSIDVGTIDGYFWACSANYNFSDRGGCGPVSYFVYTSYEQCFNSGYLMLLDTLKYQVSRNDMKKQDLKFALDCISYLEGRFDNKYLNRNVSLAVLTLI